MARKNPATRLALPHTAPVSASLPLAQLARPPRYLPNASLKLNEMWGSRASPRPL